MRTKIKLTGEPEFDLNILFKECSNNNQICYHLKKNEPLVNYLKQETGLDKKPMVLLFHYKENIKEVPKCICGRERKYHCYGYRPTCGGKKCENIVREESKKKFCLENYGVEFVTQLDTMKEKSKQTCIEKFGFDNCTKSKDIIQKRKERNLLKYGVEDPIALSKVRGKTSTDAQRGFDKIQRGLKEGYILIEVSGLYYKIACPKGHISEISKYTLSNRKIDKIEICNQCNEYIGSLGEQEVFEYIQSIYDKPISRSNRKLISPFEIDMVLEDIKLCIEFNGDYWHSTKVNDDRFYHLNKLNMCLSKGYNLIQIRENDWNINKEKIKKKLFNLINNIIDLDDFKIKNSQLILDLSWYDDRIVRNFEPVETELPSIVESGQYTTWNCGYKIFKI